MNTQTENRASEFCLAPNSLSSVGHGRLKDIVLFDNCALGQHTTSLWLRVLLGDNVSHIYILFFVTTLAPRHI